MRFKNYKNTSAVLIFKLITPIWKKINDLKTIIQNQEIFLHYFVTLEL